MAKKKAENNLRIESNNDYYNAGAMSITRPGQVRKVKDWDGGQYEEDDDDEVLFEFNTDCDHPCCGVEILSGFNGEAFTKDGKAVDEGRKATKLSKDVAELVDKYVTDNWNGRLVTAEFVVGHGKEAKNGQPQFVPVMNSLVRSFGWKKAATWRNDNTGNWITQIHKVLPSTRDK